jgi:hypothetical protein
VSTDQLNARGVRLTTDTPYGVADPKTRWVIDFGEETSLYIGAGLNGALLEAIVADLETEGPRDHPHHGTTREGPSLPLTHRHDLPGW